MATVRGSKQGKEEFWERTKSSILGASLIDTRSKRAGRIFNPFRGLNLKMTYPLSPFESPITPTTPNDSKYLA
jgi:hypothetical protein